MGLRSAAAARRFRALGTALMASALLAGIAAPAVLAAGPSLSITYITTDEDTNATGSLTAAVTASSGSLTFYPATPILASHGVLTIQSNGDYTFVPAANWHGHDTTTYQVADSGGLSLGYVDITVASVNDKPVATPQTVNVREDLAKAVTLAGTDVEGSPLTYTVASQPTHGALSGTGKDLTYTPDAAYTGDDSFTFTVNDGSLDSDPATVTIHVNANAVPVATGQDVSVVYDTAHDITLAGTDGDGDDLTFEVATQPDHGTLTGTAPALTYTPDPGFNGPDEFTFTASDYHDTSAAATVHITVAPDLVAPVVGTPTIQFGTGRVNETAPLLVAWSATDAGVGVKNYDVQVKIGTGAWTNLTSATALRSAPKAVPFNTPVQVQIRARDNNDNVSGWVQSVARTVVAYQGSSAMTWTKTWTTVAAASASGTGYRYATALGARVSYTVTGLQVAIVADKLSAGGYAKTQIDGGTVARVNLRSTTSQWGVIVRKSTLGASASHTLRLWNDQSGRRAIFDAFIVLR